MTNSNQEWLIEKAKQYAERIKREREEAKEKPKTPEPEKTIINPSNLNENDWIYVPSVNLYFSRDKMHLNKNWFESHELLQKDGYRMPIIPEFIELLKYSKKNNPKLYNEITEVKSPWRGEWLDAYFEKRTDRLYILTANKTKSEKLESCLMKDKTPGIDLEYWINGNHTNQGLPIKKSKKGDLYYWSPEDERVVGFYAGGDGADLDCDRNPSGRDSDLGVRAVRQDGGKSQWQTQTKNGS